MVDHKIELTVDKDTFLRWQAVLHNARRQFLVPITYQTAIPAVQILPTHLIVSGDRFLLEVGKAAARPELASDPARYFALLKYAAVLSETSSNLNLRDEICVKLDRHKKMVLSDEFGCGMSFLFAAEVLKASNFLDFETAERLGWVTTKPNAQERPDYVADLPRNKLLLLEAKGTQSGHKYARFQLQRGCAQLNNVTLGGLATKRVAAKVVVGTSLGFDSWPDTEVFVADPEDNGPSHYFFERDLREMTLRSHYLRVASLIGDSTLARAVEQDVNVTSSDRGPGAMEIGGRRYVGQPLSFLHQTQSCGVFLGIEEELRVRLLERRWEDVLALQSQMPSDGIVQIREPAPARFRERRTDNIRPLQLPATRELSVRPEKLRLHKVPGIEQQPPEPEGRVAVRASDGTVFASWLGPSFAR